MSRLPLVVLVVFACLAVATPARAETLTVYTYDSFVGEWGPGPAIEAAFEARCACDLEWVAVDDAGLLLTRLRLEGAGSEADVVLGLDTNLTAEARNEGLVRPHGLDLPPLDLPVAWDDPVWVPFDYGYFAVIHDTESGQAAPASLAELIDGEGEDDLIVQDPRTSTPGLGLLLWLKAVHGDDAGKAWRRLARRVLTVTGGWSEAYGLFLDGEAPMVLSYTTSPAYHRIVEGSDRYVALAFPEGHYMQIEVAAMTAATDQPDLARRFLAFVLEPAFQETIPQGNWMYPVIDLGDALPRVFRDLPRPRTALLLPSSEVAQRRTAWIREWLDAMSR